MTARLLVYVVALSGCVPKGRAELVQVQLEATRTAMSARSAQCTVDGLACDEAKASLEAEIAARQAQLDELVARATVRDAELDELQGERLALLDRIAALEAEIAGLRDAWTKVTKKPVPPRPDAVVTELGRPEVVAQIQEQYHRQLDHARAEEARIAVERVFGPLAEQGRVEVVQRGEAAVVRIATAMLFQEGFTTLSPRGQQIVAEAGTALAGLGGRRVTVEGHTDDTPVHTSEFASNWERGFSRAVTVLRGLEATGGTELRLSAASYADTVPIVPNTDAAGRARNDRVEIVIEVDPTLATRFPPTAPEPAEVPGDPSPTEPTP